MWRALGRRVREYQRTDAFTVVAIITQLFCGLSDALKNIVLHVLNIMEVWNEYQWHYDF